MKVIKCNGCKEVLQSKEENIFRRFDTVSPNKKTRWDLCETCLPFFNELVARKEEFAIDGLRQLREAEKQLTDDFWERVKSQHGPEANLR